MNKVQAGFLGDIDEPRRAGELDSRGSGILLAAAATDGHKCSQDQEKLFHRLSG